MDSSTSEREPFDHLAEEFAVRVRRGERPPLTEYTDKYPELADDIRRAFPAILMMEQLKPQKDDTAGPASSHPGINDLLGDYRILREIGRGGMGVVYEAEQVSLGRRVALKVLPAASKIDTKQLRRFEREARAAARLHHTNIVPVFGVGEHEGIAYYVMQFIAGHGLDRLLDDLRRLRHEKANPFPPSSDSGPEPPDAPSPSNRPSSRSPGEMSTAEVARSLLTGRFDEATGSQRPDTSTDDEPAPDPAPMITPEKVDDAASAAESVSSELSNLSHTDRRFYRSVARIGAQVAEALEYANRQGVLHRDIKPSNLLLDARGNVWITDFGLAKTTDSDDLTHTGDILGTIRYMAPERFRGTCDAQSDLYSLALTLYELVALRPAFEASDRHELIRKVMHESPPSVGKLEPDVPRDLETVIAKAMAREPRARYATAGAMAEDLQRFIKDEPIRARRVSALEQAWRWCRRNKLVASLTGVVVISLLAVAFVQTRRLSEQAKATAGLTKKQTDLEDALAQKNSALVRANRLLAMNNLERGRAACERGEVGPGLLWFVASLRAATEAGDPAWQRAARANLAAWRPEYPGLVSVFDNRIQVEEAAFTPDRRAVCTRGGMLIQLWSLETGQAVGPRLKLFSRLHAGRYIPGGDGLLFDVKGTPAQPRSMIEGAFSPDGSTILTGLMEGDNNSARVLDVATGRSNGEPLQHTALISSAAFSPDGKIIATGDFNRTAQLWNAASHRPLGKPLLHKEPVFALGFSPDSKVLLATTNANTTIQIWDVENGRPIGEPLTNLGQSLAIAAFSPDGKSLLTSDRGGLSVYRWDVPSGRPVRLESNVSGYPPVLSPDHRTVLVGNGIQKAQLWDMETGRRIGESIEFRGAVAHVAFSPDGKAVAIASGRAGAATRLQVWNTTNAEPIGPPIEHPDAIVGVAFRPDGKAILTVSDAAMSVRTWEVPTGKLTGPPLVHRDTIAALAFAPDGKTILTGSQDRTARLWDGATGQPIGSQFEHQDTVNSVAFGPDGKTILTGSRDRTARLWNAVKPADSPRLGRQSFTAVAFSPDGRIMATTSKDRGARLWDADGGKPVGQPLPHQDIVSVIAFSPDGKTVLTGSNDKTARLWDAATGKPLGETLNHPDIVTSVEFSPDGKTILTRTAIGYTRSWLWNTETGQPIGQPIVHQPFFGSLLFSPDGKTILNRINSFTAQMVDATTGNPIGPTVPRFPTFTTKFTLDGKLIWKNREGQVLIADGTTGLPGRPLPDQDRITELTVSPDGKILLTWSNDRTVRLWDVANAQPLTTSLPHRAAVLRAAFSPDGKTILTGSSDKTAQLWDTETGRPIGDPLVHQGAILSLAFSPDGKTALTGSTDRMIRLRSTSTGQPVGSPFFTPGISPLVQFSPDGTILLTRSLSNARLWSALTGRPIGLPFLQQGHIQDAEFSPDSKVVLTGSRDGTARLWDTATGRPVGPAIRLAQLVETVEFSPGGKYAIFRNRNETRLRHITEFPDDLARISLWSQARTGLELDEEGGIDLLDTAAWTDRRRRLVGPGGSPLTDDH